MYCTLYRLYVCTSNTAAQTWSHGMAHGARVARGARRHLSWVEMGEDSCWMQEGGRDGLPG